MVKQVLPLQDKMDQGVMAPFSAIWPIDRTLAGATTPGQSGPESDGDEEVLCIPQCSSITGSSR